MDCNQAGANVSKCKYLFSGMKRSRTDERNGEAYCTVAEEGGEESLKENSCVEMCGGWVASAMPRGVAGPRILFETDLDRKICCKRREMWAEMARRWRSSEQRRNRPESSPYSTLHAFNLSIIPSTSAV